MPMFYTPKPRQFHYKPRFYDPDKEDWEALKAKYANKSQSKSDDAAAETPAPAELASEKGGSAAVDMAAELAYFESRDRDIARKEQRKAAKFGWRDLVRKREMPKFNYQPRFASNETTGEGSPNAQPAPARDNSGKRRIARRFDMEDSHYFEPVSAGKIMLYVLAACLLLAWILL